MEMIGVVCRIDGVQWAHIFFEPLSEFGGSHDRQNVNLVAGAVFTASLCDRVMFSIVRLRVQLNFPVAPSGNMPYRPVLSKESE